jgi:uncharacterized repeat protein (TIGR01451 family)
MLTGQQQLFTATGYDQNDNVYVIDPIWSTDGGTIDQDGKYTATVPGDFSVTSSVSGSTVTGTASVHVDQSPYLEKIEVSPSSVSMLTGQQQLFTATGYDQNDNVYVIDPIWFTDGGTIDQDGKYTATVPGDFTVTASVSGSTVTGTANVHVSQSDVQPPAVSSFDIYPTNIDTSGSSKDVIVTARLTDDFSGIGTDDTAAAPQMAIGGIKASYSPTSLWSGAIFVSPSGNQFASVSFQQKDRVSGTALDGIYKSKMTLPKGSEMGGWKLDHVILSDKAGNINRLSRSDMAALGFSTDFQIGLLPGLVIEKKASSGSVSPGELLNFTIKYANGGSVNLTGVVITESYPQGVEFIAATPAPDAGTNDRWTIGDLPVDGTGTIVVTVRTSDQEDIDFQFAEEERTIGVGFVNVRKGLSTSSRPRDLKNVVTIVSREAGPFSAAASVTFEDPGTELEGREHGSGTYESEELVAMLTDNESITMEKDMAATHEATTLTLPRNRTVTYTSPWTEEAKGKNRATATTMTESYRYATSIDRDSKFRLDENESVMEIEVEFEGMGHIGFLKMPSNTSTTKTTPLFESSEDYSGSFKVLEKADEYGSSVSSEKAASGSGLAVIDKRVGESQRSYESGTGSYDSEELIETYTNYIAKDISLVHEPMSQRLTDGVSINSSLKWTEGMYSKNPRASLIGEEYTSIIELDKETVARGLREMDTDADFSGQARYRAVLERNGSKPEVNLDEAYVGDYSVERRVIFTGVAKYDRPHLNVTKTLVGIVEETLPWGRGEEHLAGETKTRDVASYTIEIENDGNKALGPIYVQDLFPPGSAYIEASIRPSELTETYANWTLMNIGIGDAVDINLKLDVSEYSPSELVNRVKVCGGINNGDEWACASNYSALEVEWLTCSPGGPIAVETSAETNGSVVRCKIGITNLEDATRVATVIDHLPEGMELVESSVPFASYEDGVVIWNLVEIPASGTVAIEFSALAPGPGRFKNFVEVDARSVDGPVVQPVTARCVIEVGLVEEGGTVSCDSWQPPNWEFEHYGYGSNEMTCEGLTCTIRDGTDSCPVS